MSRLILAIEDDKAISELYQELLSEAGYQVRVMTSKPLDVQIIEYLQPNLIISDWRMAQDESNWNFINAMRHTSSTAAIPILVCTAISLKINQLGERLNERKITVLQKPFDIDELLRLVEDCWVKPACEVLLV